MGTNGRLDPWAIKRAIGEGGHRPHWGVWAALVVGMALLAWVMA